MYLFRLYLLLVLGTGRVLWYILWELHLMKDMLSYPLYVPPCGGHAVLRDPSVILALSKENYDDEQVLPAHRTVTALCRFFKIR